MNKEKVTRADLRAMKPGQSEVFMLPTVEKLESARATVQQMKAFGMEFTTSIKYAESCIIINRIK